MKTSLIITIALAFALLASCSNAPKAPDPFDTLLIEAARKMFEDTNSTQP